MNSKKKKLVVISSIVGIISILVVLVLLLVCFHNWKDATCLTPITCEKCGETQGEPLGHEWVEANCTEAKHCVKCNISEGEALGHTIKEMKTTKESRCSIGQVGTPITKTVITTVFFVAEKRVKIMVNCAKCIFHRIKERTESTRSAKKL